MRGRGVAWVVVVAKERSMMWIVVWVLLLVVLAPLVAARLRVARRRLPEVDAHREALGALERIAS